MGEVTEMLDVKPSLIRFWGTKFTCLKPKRNQKGNRMFSPEDVANLKLIYHLVKEKNMTLEGAAKVIKAEKIASSDKSGRIAAIEKLQLLKAHLLAIKQSLGSDDVEPVDEPDITEEVPAERNDAPAAAVEKEASVPAMEPGDTADEAVPVTGSGAEEKPGKPRASRRKVSKKPVEQSLFKDPELFQS